MSEHRVSMSEEQQDGTELPQIRIVITMTEAPDGDHLGMKAIVRNRDREVSPIEVLGLMRLAEIQYVDELESRP